MEKLSTKRRKAVAALHKAGYRVLWRRRRKSLANIGPSEMTNWRRHYEVRELSLIIPR